VLRLMESSNEKSDMQKGYDAVERCKSHGGATHILCQNKRVCDPGRIYYFSQERRVRERLPHVHVRKARGSGRLRQSGRLQVQDRRIRN